MDRVSGFGVSQDAARGGRVVGGDGIADRCVLSGRGAVITRRQVDYRGDVELDGVGTLISVLATIGCAAIVLDLEGETGQVIAVGIGRALPGQFGNIRERNVLTRCHRYAVEQQRAGGRQRGDDDRAKVVGRRCVQRVGKAKVSRAERVGGVFNGGNGLVCASGRVVDRRDSHRRCQCV